MNVKKLVSQIKNSSDVLQKNAVNTHLTLRNWLTGFYIVEFEQNGEHSSGYVKDTVVLNKEFLKNKISVWGDSTIILTFKRGGLEFIKFKNDSLYDDGFSSDSLLKTYHISDSAGTLVMEFNHPRSAITGIPSIFDLHIYKYQSGRFYGSVDNISPNLSIEKKFTDTMQMMSWERWRKEEKLIK